jgi:hypothetical protein
MYLITLISIVSAFPSSAENTNTILDGVLIYTTGGKQIKKLDLSVPKTNPIVIYESPYRVSTVNQVAKINSMSFVFDEKPIKKGAVIKKFNLNDKVVVPLFPGKLPFCSKEGKEVFFYRSEINIRGVLLIASFDRVETTRIVADEPALRKLPNGVLQSLTTPGFPITIEEVIFLGEGNRLYVYNIQKGNIQKTNILNCHPMAYRCKTKEIICRDIDSSEIYLTDKKYSHRHELPNLQGIYGAVYIPEYDSLLYGRTRFQLNIGERYDVFIYSFASKEQNLVIEDEHITAGFWIKKGD